MSFKPAPQPAIYEDLPPPYDSHENFVLRPLSDHREKCLPRQFSDNDEKRVSRNLSTHDELLPINTLDIPHATASRSDGLSLPCVIPQTTKTLRGAFHSPFIRAWTPELLAHNISQSDFLTFLDGLNECFVAHPVFEGAGVAGQVMQMFYGIHPVRLAGIGLSVASGVASAGTSYFRSRAYIKEMNQDFFHPAGLHCNILTTKKMMDKVGCPEEKLRLQAPDVRPGTLREASYLWNDRDSRSSESSSSAPQDVQMRRLEALRGYVLPLELDVPVAVAPDNLLKKMGAAQAARMSRKQNKKDEKRAVKAQEDSAKEVRKADKEQRKLDKELAKFEKELNKLRAELERDLAKEDSSRKREKLTREFEKEEKKLEREVEKEIKKAGKKVDEQWEKAGEEYSKPHRKEEKAANKVRWIVISQWSEDTDEMDDDGLPSSDEATEDGDARSFGGEKPS